MLYKTIVYCPEKCNNNQFDLTVLNEIFLAKFGKNTDFPCPQKRLIIVSRENKVFWFG